MIKTRPAQRAGGLQGPALVRQAVPDRHPERVEPAGPPVASFATLGKNTTAGDRRHDHRQLVHVGLRRDPDDDARPRWPPVGLTQPHPVPETPPSLHVPRPEETRAARRDGHGAGLAPAPPRQRHLQGRGPGRRRSCAGGPRRRPTRSGVIVVHLGYSERLWLRAICAGEQMDMAWRAHMFELPGGLGRGGGRGLLPRRRARGPTPSSTRPPRSTFPPGATSARRRSAGPCSTSLRRRPATSGTWTSPASCSTAASAAEHRPDGSVGGPDRPECRTAVLPTI